MRRNNLFIGIPVAILLLFFSKTSRAGGYFSFSPTAEQAYGLILELRLKEAEATLGYLKIQEPDNLIGVFLESWADFIRLVADDDKPALRNFLKKADNRLDQLSTGDPSSPLNAYTRGEINLHCAVLHARFGEYFRCLGRLKTGYGLLEKNRTQFPDFIANKKSLGLIHALVGNVPPEYRWALTTLGGLDGTVEQGMQEIESVLQYAQKKPYIFEKEALGAYCFLLIYLKNDLEKAGRYADRKKLDPQKSPLFAYALASLAYKTGHSDEAIEILEQSPKGEAYSPFLYNDYLLGLVKLSRLDADAHKALERFVNGFQGGNGLKEAYQKLAWFHLVNGNENGYKTYMNYAKLKGETWSEPDKAALREAESGKMPDARLLKARLLFDGGYSKRAWNYLQPIENQFINNKNLLLEYRYRMGRIAHQLGKTSEAKSYYQVVIDTGSKSPEYFACNAALQMGVLYESQKDWKNARLYFKKCLALHPDDYAASLHGKAKAGLKRLR